MKERIIQNYKTYPKHCPEIRVSEAERYIADVKAFWLTFQVCALGCGGRCGCTWSDRYQSAALDGALGVALVAGGCGGGLLTAAARGRCCRGRHCCLKHLRLSSKIKDRVSIKNHLMCSRLVANNTANKTLPASPFSSFYFTFYIRYILYRILEDSYQEPTSFHVQIVIEFSKWWKW